MHKGRSRIFLPRTQSLLIFSDEMSWGYYFCRAFFYSRFFHTSWGDYYLCEKWGYFFRVSLGRFFPISGEIFSWGDFFSESPPVSGKNPPRKKSRHGKNPPKIVHPEKISPEIIPKFRDFFRFILT